jgi:hypothetical protein
MKMKSNEGLPEGPVFADEADRAPPKSMLRKARYVLCAAAAIWLTGIAYGVVALYNFESTPGVSGLTPASWPAMSTIIPRPGHSTLVMMVHPQCSCTSASLSELGAIVSRARGEVDAIVLFIQSAGLNGVSEKGATWSQAQQIPGVSIVLDPRGSESARFRALTSGYAVLYNPGGHLLFAGGITESRGHAGDNMGREFILASLTGKSTSLHKHAVFGCPLTDQADQADQVAQP